MKARTIGLAVLALALAGAACQPAAQQTTTSEADMEAVAAVIEREVAALNAGSVTAFRAVYTDDALVMPPNEPAVRGEQVDEWQRAFLGMFSLQLSYSNEEIELAGDWAFHLYALEVTLTPKAGGESMVETGKGIHILERQPDGSWLIAVDTWNSDLPLPAEASETEM